MADTPRGIAPDTPRLSAREVRFCVGYAEHGNAYRAHKEAGIEAVSDQARYEAASQLLRKPEIMPLVRRMQDEAVAAAQVTADRIVEGLARIAFADRSGLFDARGRVLPPGQWPADVTGTVEGIDTEEVYETVSEPGKPKRRELVGYARKVRTARRTEALKLLMQWKRMIGSDAEASKPPPAPLVVGGEADPGAL